MGQLYGLEAEKEKAVWGVLETENGKFLHVEIYERKQNAIDAMEELRNDRREESYELELINLAVNPWR